jgi:hypothetical protein
MTSSGSDIVHKAASTVAEKIGHLTDYEQPHAVMQDEEAFMGSQPAPLSADAAGEVRLSSQGRAIPSHVFLEERLVRREKRASRSPYILNIKRALLLQPRAAEGRTKCVPSERLKVAVHPEALRV